MLFAGLHPAGGHRPDASFEIDLIPARTDHLAGSGRGQDGELKRLRSDALALAQLRHERRQLSVGQGGVVLDLAVGATSGQSLRQMATPAGRVVALAIAAHGGPAEHRLDPTAQP